MVPFANTATAFLDPFQFEITTATTYGDRQFVYTFSLTNDVSAVFIDDVPKAQPPHPSRRHGA